MLLHSENIILCLTVFGGLLPSIICGLYEAWTSVYLPKLLSGDAGIDFNVTALEGSWITVALTAGGLIGSLIYFPIFNKFGRKKTLLTVAFPFLVSPLMLAYGNNVITFCMARFIAGIGVAGFFAVIPQYLAEIAPKTIRGAIGTGIYVFNVIGFLLINVVGSYTSVKESSFMTIAIAVVYLVIFVWVPESPYYLIMINKDNEAKQSLQTFRNNDVDNEFERIKDAVIEQNKDGRKFLELFTVKSNRRALLILFIVLNGKQLTGDFSFDTYAQSIFYNLCHISPTLFAVIYYISKLLVISLNSFLTDKFGRRPMLLISLLGSALILLVIAIYLHFNLHTSVEISDSIRYVMIVVMVLFTVFYSLLVAIPVILLGELFPMNVKTSASLLFVLYFFLSSLGTVKFFQVVNDSNFLGMDVAFFTFSISCFLHLVLVYFFVFETKGRSLEAIQEHLKSSHFS